MSSEDSNSLWVVLMFPTSTSIMLRSATRTDEILELGVEDLSSSEGPDGRSGVIGCSGWYLVVVTNILLNVGCM